LPRQPRAFHTYHARSFIAPTVFPPRAITPRLRRIDEDIMTKPKSFTRKSLLLAASMLACPLIASLPRPAAAQISIAVQIAPPELPVYVQPPIPEVGYLWTPGYWAYANAGYYWVPGTWVEPPEVGVLWTPPYWGWFGGEYRFHGGYWGNTVGFYGGVNYGFGYGGSGYEGGRWDGGHFAYNSSVNNFGGVHITNVYNRSVTVNNVSHTSFNGGPGGVTARASAAELAAESSRHIPPTAAQIGHVQIAARTPELAARANGGHPALAATARPGQIGHSEATPHTAARPAERAEDHTTAAGIAHHADGAAARPEPHEDNAAHAEPHAAAAPRPTAHHAAPPAHHTAVHRPESRPQTHTEARPEERPEPRMQARPEQHQEAPRAAPAEHHAAPPEHHAAPAEHHEEHPHA